MAKLSPLFNCQTVTDAGVPASGWKLNSYVAGSASAQSTYTGEDGLTAQANPIELSADGYPPSPIWLTSGAAYKFILTDENDAVQRTFDDVSGINDTTTSASQWQASGVTPTYVSASSFTLVGDQTTEFHVGRRVQCTVTAGTVYGVISVAAYGVLSTITVVMDGAQVLDSGLSAINLSLLRADNSALPKRDYDAQNVLIGASKSVVFEGATDNAFETTLSAVDPTADRVVSLPDATDTLVGKATTDVLTNKSISGATNTITGVVNTAAAQATTSGVAIDFNDIPSWVKRITLSFASLSTNGTSGISAQIGDSGGIETSGYLCGTSNAGSSTTELLLSGGSSADAGVLHGSLVLTLINSATNTWAATSVVGRSDSAACLLMGGSKSLTATLDRVRLKTGNGTDAFDAGSANILYE